MSRVRIHNDTAKEEQETEKKKKSNGHASVVHKRHDFYDQIYYPL